jgi:hypothetical protein
MDTEQIFDIKFDVVSTTQAIVDKIKSDVKTKYGKKKRHNQ